MDFSLKKYEEILKYINQNNIPIYGILEWFRNKPQTGIILKHDVDKKPINSLKIAKLEHKYNIKSSFYFRVSKNSFNPSIIKQIADLGHEIGYHYDDFSVANGDIKLAKQLFEENISKLKQLAEIKTIAMYGNPMSKYDSREMWEILSLKDFNIEAEAFLSIKYVDFFYFIDTGKNWSNIGSNIKDKAVSNRITDVKTSDELINFIGNNKNEKIAIVTHPKRWTDNVFENISRTSKDLLINIFKRVLMFFR